MILALLCGVLVTQSCSDDPASPADELTTVYGDAVTIGNGTARSYIVSKSGTPTEIGVALSETALDNLPPGQTMMDAKSYLLPLPANNPTGYQIVEANWNPVGHPPPMVYTVPHFDFHFYVVSLAARNAIMPSDPQFAAKAANLPPVSERPAGYIVMGNGGQPEPVPMMGVHWVNPASPEFHGSPFTRTFIFGSWDGDFTFMEPMVALSYLKTKPDAEEAVPSSSAFASADQPGSYRVAWNAQTKEYRISLTHLGGN